MRLNHCV